MVLISMPLWTLHWYFEMCLFTEEFSLLMRHGVEDEMALAPCVTKILPPRASGRVSDN